MVENEEFIESGNSIDQVEDKDRIEMIRQKDCLVIVNQMKNVATP